MPVFGFNPRGKLASFPTLGRNRIFGTHTLTGHTRIKAGVSPYSTVVGGIAALAGGKSCKKGRSEEMERREQKQRRKKIAAQDRDRATCAKSVKRVKKDVHQTQMYSESDSDSSGSGSDVSDYEDEDEEENFDVKSTSTPTAAACKASTASKSKKAKVASTSKGKQKQKQRERKQTPKKRSKCTKAKEPRDVFDEVF